MRQHLRARADRYGMVGACDSEMVRHYYHLNDEEANRHMNRLDLLGPAGMQPAGTVNRAADMKSEEAPARKTASMEVIVMSFSSEVCPLAPRNGHAAQRLICKYVNV